MRASRPTSRPRGRLGMLLLASSTILASCSTTRTTGASGPPVPPPKSSGALYVPCLEDPVIKFNAPDPDHPIPESAANAYDTPETISAVRKHNAAVRGVCNK